MRHPKGQCVVQVWFEEDDSANGRRANFDLIQTELPDFQSVCTLVDGDRLIGGIKLLTHRGEGKRERVVHNTTPIAFRGSAVRRIEITTWNITMEVD